VEMLLWSALLVYLDFSELTDCYRFMMQMGANSTFQMF